MDHLKNHDRKDPHQIIEALRELEKQTEQPQYDLERRQDVKINLRIDESISPAKFKPDPLIPGGFVANSLTIRAMRSDLFVLGDSIDDLSLNLKCSCGQEIDVQFWKLCPYCGIETKRLF
jgi:hypothetical protein